MGVIPLCPFLFTAFTWISFGSGPERECCELTDCCWRGFDHISLVHPSCFNILAGVAHSLAMWSQPWHLNHCNELESLVLWAPPCAPFCNSIFPLHWESVLSLPAAEELQMEAVWPRPVWPLWELGQIGVFLSAHPLPWPLCLGLLGALAGQLPCSTLVKAAVNLANWSPSSFEPEATSVEAADITFTLSLVSSISLSTWHAAITSSE